jgi:hypothetical protein
VPDDHLVRAIAAVLDLSWVHTALASYYPRIGRPSIDPVLMIRMLIVGYECKIARNIGSDSLSMKFADGMAVSSERNQHHASTFSCFLPGPQRTDRRQRRAYRGHHHRDGSRRYPGGDVPSVSFSFAARSQSLCSASFGPAVLRSERMPSGRDAAVLLRETALPKTDFCRTL